MKNHLQTLLALALCLAADRPLHALTAATLPACGANEFLSYQSGGLTCTTVGGGGVTLGPGTAPARFTSTEILAVTNGGTVEARVRIASSSDATAAPSNIGTFVGITKPDLIVMGEIAGVIADLQTNGIRLLERQQDGVWIQRGITNVDMSSTTRVVRVTQDFDLTRVYLDGVLIFELAHLPGSRGCQMEVGANHEVPPPAPSLQPAGGGIPVGATIAFIGLSNDGALAPGQFSFVETNPPSITCFGNPTMGAAPNQCSAPLPVNYTASDDLGGVTVVCVPAVGAALPVGQHAVTCTATDASGNTNACSFTFTVLDGTPPQIISCPASRTLPNDPGVLVPNLIPEVVATDACTTNLVITQSPPAGSTAGQGTQTVTLTVRDAAGNTNACTTTLTLNAAPVCAMNFSTGLLGYWPFDDAAGATAADASPNGNHGALNNFPGDNSQWVAGKIGGALNFRGAGPNDYVRVPAFPHNAITTTMSVGAWVWADTRATWGTILKNWGSTIPGKFHFGLWDADGDLSMVVQEGDGTEPSVRENTALPVGQWQHVLFVADGSHLRLYRNGALVGGPVAYDGTITNPPVMTALGIGVKLDDAGVGPAAQRPGYWHGKLDELALWSRPLSGCEAQALYLAGQGGTNLLNPNIRDTTPPTLICANVTVPEEGPLFCYANVPFEPVAIDACGKPTVVCVPPSGSFFNVGTAPVNCTATDACGNTASCTFTVTVVSTNDVSPPFFFTCPELTLLADAFTCSAILPDYGEQLRDGNYVVDNGCTLPARLIMSQTPPVGTVVSNGVHTVIVTATDLNGNSSTCSIPVTVNFEQTCQMYLANGLLGYWPFDETNGLTANDATFWGNHGSLSNYTGDAQWVPGQVGGALSFGGPNSQQFVRVPDYLKFIDSTMSVAAWVWADAHTPWATVVKNWGSTIPGQFHLGLWDAAGDLSSVIQEGDGSQIFVRENTPLPTGRWEHIVFVADGTNLWLCRNGVLVAGPVAYDGTITNPPATNPLGIGVKLDDAGEGPAAVNPGFWQGKLDEVALWSRPLSRCEVLALYEAGRAGKNLFDPSIRDVTPPAIVCPANITHDVAQHGCSRVVNFAVTAEDACSKAIVTCVPPGGSTFPDGLTLVNCAARDVCGNTNFCSFTVNVIGGALNLACPPPQTAFANCALIPVPDFTAAAMVTGGCPPGGPFTLTQTPPAGTLVAAGTHPVVLQASNAAGSTAQCVVEFLVQEGRCVPLHSRAILWLPFDEPTGTIARNLVGGGNGGHGGSPTPNPAGLVFGSLGFDGTNDFVRVPNYSGLGRNAGSFTVESWVKRAAGDGGRRVIVSRQGQFGTNAGLHGFEFLLDNGQMAARVITPSATQDLSSGVTVPADGQWHHVVMLFAMSSSARFYLDGALAATVPHSRNFRMDVAGDVFVGSGGPAAHSFFKGWLDEVVMHSNSQLPSEVQAVWAAGASGRCKLYCGLPWDRHFTSNLVSLALPPGRIYNSHATPVTVNWSIASLGLMPILTPTSGSAVVPPFGSVGVPVTVGAPPFTNKYHFWTMTVTWPQGCPMVCTGLVAYTGPLAATVPPGVTTSPGTNGVINTTVPLTGLQPGQPGRASVVNMNTMMPDTNVVSLNGLPPGTPVLFSAPAPSPLPGGGGVGLVSLDLDLNIRFLEPDPVSIYVIVIEVELDGEMTPITSFDVQNTFVPPPTLRIVAVGNERQLHWNDEGDGLGVLESASAVTGPWNPVLGAAPGYVLPATGAQQFYRVAVP